MTAKELRRARAWYIGHLLVSLIGYFVVFFSADSLGLTAYHASFGEVMLFLGYLFAGLFVVQWVSAVLFRRTGRPWHMKFGIPLEDRWPRA